jgi:hypothetical protein
MKRQLNVAPRLIVLLTLTLTLSACREPPDITWQSDIASPDGNWTATGMTVGTSGFGTGALWTAIYLKRTGAKGQGFEILGYDEDTSTWVRGKAPLAMTWDGPTKLLVTFKRIPDLNVQVCKYGAITIAVNALP